MTTHRSRREFLKHITALSGAAVFGGHAHLANAEISPSEWLGKSISHVACRAITSGPKHHWFGYYDKQQFSADSRFVLSNEVSFEHRTPTASDTIGVGMVDLHSNDEWVPLGTSSAWGWQQGCMLQWRPAPNGESSHVLWNDREQDRFVCRMMNVKSNEAVTVDRPIYAVSPDGKWAISADFARIQTMRPGYGYQGVADPVADQKAPEESGIWRIDLESGKIELIVSLAEVAAIPYRGKTLEDKWNYFNHLLVNTDGTRFIVLHRWRDDDNGKPAGRFTTRMFTIDPDGSNKYILDPSGYTSHFIWDGPNRVCAWTRPEGKKDAFWLFEDKTRNIQIVGEGVMTKNGHNTYLPVHDNNWILNDTYPTGPNRWQTPYLYHVPTRKRTDLGSFHLPPQYKGEWRCDTHPRSSTDGKLVTIDSPHGGSGRQVWLLDVSQIIATNVDDQRK